MIKKDEIKPTHQTARDDPPDKRYNSRQDRVSDQNDSKKRDK